MVEFLPSKQAVAGSNPVSRSISATNLTSYESSHIEVETPLDIPSSRMLRVEFSCIQQIHINQTRVCCGGSWIFNFLVGSSNCPIKVDASTLGDVSGKRTNSL